MIEKFTFDLQLPPAAYLRQSNPDEHISLKQPVRKKIILVKNDLELRAHVVLKLLSYMLFYDPRLQIEMNIGMHYKPDLVIPGDHGVPELWIDCGQIALKKVDSLSIKLKATRICLVKETKREMESFRKVIEKKVDYPEKLEYLAFENGFVTGLADALARTNEVTLYEIMENVIGVALNDEIFESALFR